MNIFAKIPTHFKLPFERIACKTQTMATTPAAKPQGQFAQIKDHKIHYEKIGQGEHNLLLLPGALGSIRTDFSPQLEALSRKNFTIYAWDPPGYGFSRPPDRTTPEKFLHRDAQVAEALLKHLGVDKVSLVGWSDGGITALIIAANIPNKIRKLVAFGANAYVTAQDSQLYQGVRDIEKWSPRMREPMIKLYGEDYFRKQWAGWVDAILEYKDGDICKQDLKNIQCPTLIIHGAKDPMVPSEHPRYLCDNIKNSRYVEFPEGKHNLHLQFADKFNKLVEDFLLEN